MTPASAGTYFVELRDASGVRLASGRDDTELTHIPVFTGIHKKLPPDQRGVFYYLIGLFLRRFLNYVTLCYISLITALEDCLASILLAISPVLVNDLKFRWLNTFGLPEFILYGIFIQACH
ncbi:MAG: hypothetical protein U0T56_10185 [Ferruginibacter sp.]